MSNIVGFRARRIEEPRLLTGRGRFVDDVQLPGMLHASFLRSPFPHARITRIDTARARALPGVVAVYTEDDIAALSEPMQVRYPVQGYKTPQYRPMASDKVRYVGDLVAMVVAESRYLAEDAAEQIHVEYDPLPVVATIEHAFDTTRPAIFEEAGDNVFYQDTFEYGDVAAAMEEADHVIRETFRQHRYAGVPLETRGAVAAYDPSTQDLTYHAASRSPHSLRIMLSTLTRTPTQRFRVICGDVGGAFGLKGSVYREDVCLCVATRLLGRPIKWIEDRNENLMASGQAREETLDVEAAVRSDGTILGLGVKMILDQGAYPLMPFPSAFITTVVRVMLPGPYRIPAYRFEANVVATNKCSYVAYRGPWEVETWVRERMMDVIARRLKRDPIEIRRTNLVSESDMPTAIVTGPSLDGVTSLASVERALELIDHEAFRERQRGAWDEGRYLGLGIATSLEPAPGPPNFYPSLGMPLAPDRTVVRLEPDGRITLFTGQAPTGQGIETTLAQVAAQELGVGFDKIKVVHGDTLITPFSAIGTGGSRSTTMAGNSAMHAARELRSKILTVAAHLLKADIDDLTISDGTILLAGGAEKSMPLAQVGTVAYMAPAQLPPGMGRPLEGNYDYTGGNTQWTVGTHACIVEINPETGQTRIERYVVVEDCGTIINPAVVEGQIRGGVAQGIGAVLYERSAYDEEGQFLAGTFMDYLLPTSMEVPDIEIHHMEATGTDVSTARGVGEGGNIIAPATLTNAIEDALSPLGVTITEQHLPPSRLLELAGLLR